MRGGGWGAISSGAEVTQRSQRVGEEVSFATMDRAKQSWLFVLRQNILSDPTL